MFSTETGINQIWAEHLYKHLYNKMFLVPYYLVSISPISSNCKGKQAHCDDCIGNFHSYPHWYVGWIFFSRRHGCLQWKSTELLIHNVIQLVMFSPFAFGSTTLFCILFKIDLKTFRSCLNFGKGKEPFGLL